MADVELGLVAFWILITAGALSGVLSVWAFRRFTDVNQLRGATNRMLAHLLEFRLFADEPRLIMRAQRGLLTANARMLRMAALPSLILLLPYALLLAVCDAYFGHSALKPGDPTVVTIRCAEPGASALRAFRLKTPVGMKVETSAVHVIREKEVSWRIRPLAFSEADLEVIDGDLAVTKTICAEQGLHWISAERTRAIRFFAHPWEPPMTNAALLSISVQYPAATVLRVHWLVWFIAGSCAGALTAMFSRAGVFQLLRYWTG